MDFYKAEDLAVYDMLNYCFGWQDLLGNELKGETGKGLRPSLCLFAAEALGGSYNKAIQSAISLNFLFKTTICNIMPPIKLMIFILARGDRWVICTKALRAYLITMGGSS